MLVNNTDCPGIGGHLNGENIANYEGCSKISFNMGMDESLTVEGLSILSEVREVDGPS